MTTKELLDALPSVAAVTARLDELRAEARTLRELLPVLQRAERKREHPVKAKKDTKQ